MSDYISDEIEDLEERLGVYLKGLGGHPRRDTLLSKKIKNMEKQLDILKKAKAFDRIRKYYNDCSYTDEINGFPYINESNFRELCEGAFEDYESGELE